MKSYNKTIYNRLRGIEYTTIDWLLEPYGGQNYIGEFEYVDNHRSGKIVVELNGRLNKCGVISPRFNVGD
ncbi:hypothetical protein KY284_020907 [Solanum tuberosum]|nr:hypothetical protein KY284_020907 [Solanum tuberosum]